MNHDVNLRPGPAEKKPLVFVVDDEHVISTTLARVLNLAGFDAHGFDHLHQAVAATQELKPEVLITDVVMPEMSGVELAMHFSATLPQCKILLFSGQTRTDDLLEEARRQGYDFDVLAKPVHPTKLIRTIAARLAAQSPTSRSVGSIWFVKGVDPAIHKIFFNRACPDALPQGYLTGTPFRSCPQVQSCEIE